MNNKELAAHIKTQMSDMRFRHTMGVAETAKKLAGLSGVQPGKAETAALLHDIARDFSEDHIWQMCQIYNINTDEVEKKLPDLLHGKIGAWMARDSYGIEDHEILDAVRFHTTGRKNMSVLEKIIFVADMIEPERSFPGVDKLRELASQNLNGAVIAGIDSTLCYVIKQGLLIHPDSIEARNSLLGLTDT